MAYGVFSYEDLNILLGLLEKDEGERYYIEDLSFGTLYDLYTKFTKYQCLVNSQSNRSMQPIVPLELYSQIQAEIKRRQELKR